MILRIAYIVAFLALNTGGGWQPRVLLYLLRRCPLTSSLLPADPPRMRLGRYLSGVP